MAVPNVNDLSELIPYDPGDSVVTRQGDGFWRCSSPGGGIARLHYDLEATPIPFGEPFEIGCEIVLNQQWGRGGTILRVESYAPTGMKLWRTELDIFGDGLPHLVRNCHTNGGATHEYVDLGAARMRLPIGSPCLLVMRGVLSTFPERAWTEVVLNGGIILTSEAHNVTAGQGTPGAYTRARYCQVQGPSNAVQTTLRQAWVRPFHAVPPPPPPPEDPCQAVRNDLANAQALVETLRVSLAEERARAAALEARINAFTVWLSQHP